MRRKIWKGTIQQGLAAIRKAKEVEWALWFTVEPGTNEIAKSFLDRARRHSGGCCAATGSAHALADGANGSWADGRDLQFEPNARARLTADRAVPEIPRRGIHPSDSSNSNGDAKSALVLASREAGKEWTRALVARLRTMGNLFGTALHRRRAEVELRDKKEWLEMALEASRTALWDLDVLTGKVRWSQGDDSLLGKTPVELELSWEKFLERVPEEDRDDLYRRTLATLRRSVGKRRCS